MSPPLHYAKEAKPRRPVTAGHPAVRAAIKVLTNAGGGPLTSRTIYERARRMNGVDVNYNSLRSRLAQHCDLPDAVVVRSAGSKLGVRGARGPGWVLRSTGNGIQADEQDGLVICRAVRPQSQASRCAAKVRLKKRAQARARDLVLSDEFLADAPTRLRKVAGLTVRDALISDLDRVSVRCLLRRLPIAEDLRERLLAAESAEERTWIIQNEERIA